MSTTPAPIDGEGFHVVVADDGSLPAAELARLGVRPGAHLRLLVDEQDRPKRKTMLGALAGTVPPEEVDRFIRALDESKAERIAYFTEQTNG